MEWTAALSEISKVIIVWDTSTMHINKSDATFFVGDYLITDCYS